jgi:hypothetical protein
VAEFGIQSDQHGPGGRRNLRVPETQEEECEADDKQAVLQMKAAPDRPRVESNPRAHGPTRAPIHDPVGHVSMDIAFGMAGAGWQGSRRVC